MMTLLERWFGHLFCSVGWHDWPQHWAVYTMTRRYQWCRRCGLKRSEPWAGGN